MYELVDAESGKAVAILDLAWPNGLQEGYSQPVALLIDEPTEVEEAVNRAGFRFFTDVDSFRDYVNRDVLAVKGAIRGHQETYFSKFNSVWRRR